MDNTPLIHRLNRAQGQIEAIKKTLQDGSAKNCLETIRLLKASQSALKKFAQAYIAQHLEECMRNKISEKQLKEDFEEVLESVFTL